LKRQAQSERDVEGRSHPKEPPQTVAVTRRVPPEVVLDGGHLSPC
jgi:hypothetical protein